LKGSGDGQEIRFVLPGQFSTKRWRV
jgi:hypothetical protein